MKLARVCFVMFYLFAAILRTNVHSPSSALVVFVSVIIAASCLNFVDISTAAF